MPGQQTSRAIVFIDLGGPATRGKTAASDFKELRNQWKEQFQQCLEERNGRLVQSVRNALRSAFDTVDEAVYAACALHQLCASLPNDGSEASPQLRVGVHWGKVMMLEGSYTREAAKTAAMLTLLSRAGQVLVTEEAYAEASAELQQKMQLRRKAAKRASSAASGAVYEVPWKKIELPEPAPAQDAAPLTAKSPEKTVGIGLAIPDSLIAAPGAGSKLAPVRGIPLGGLSGDAAAAAAAAKSLRSGQAAARLIITCSGGKEYTVDRKSPTMTIGRESTNDIVCDTEGTSRQHAKIEFHKGRFLFIDESFNGTIVYDATEDHETHVHNESVWLPDRGSLGLGYMIESDGPPPVRYRIEKG